MSLSLSEPIEASALCVRVVDYGESDRIVTLLCRDQGKVAAMARGARRSRRRFGALGLYGQGRARLRERRGAELLLLESWEPTGDPTALAADLARLAHAGYVCELGRELSAPSHPEPEAFDLITETLGAIARADPVRKEILRVFEVGLLDRLGLGPALDRCAVCGRTDAAGPAGGWIFDLSRGGVVCEACPGAGPPLPEAARQALRRARTLTIGEAAALELDAATNAACREALLAAVHQQLGRPLRSLEFLGKLRRNS